MALFSSSFSTAEDRRRGKWTIIQQSSLHSSILPSDEMPPAYYQDRKNVKNVVNSHITTIFDSGTRYQVVASPHRDCTQIAIHFATYVDMIQSTAVVLRSAVLRVIQ